MILQQDDVTSFRMVEKNGEANTSDQILCFSIGDNSATIATTAQPLKFFVNGSPTGVTYQGLSGTEVLRLNTNGNAQFYGELGITSTVSTTGSFKSTVGGTSEIRLQGGGYGVSYNTSLRSIAGAVGILQFGNNGENCVLIGNTGTSSNTYLSFRVNCTTEATSAGTEAFRISSTGTGNSSAYFTGALTAQSTLTVSGAATLGTTALISGKLTAAGGYYLYGGSYNTSYTSDGLWGGSATPNKVQTTSGGNFILGYNDNGSGLYAPAYGFEVRQTDGLGNNITIDAIIMRNTETGARPFVVTNKGSLTLAGSLSKGSGSFKINHPLQSKKNKNYLLHSFLEGPKADLLYRGKINLVNGLAIINIDTTAGMTEGTFEVLCRDVQCFTTNESGWDLVKGTVTGNILTITSQNSDSNDLISWLVIGERQDEHMYETEWTDENGRVILEPEIPEGVIL